MAPGTRNNPVIALFRLVLLLAVACNCRTGKSQIRNKGKTDAPDYFAKAALGTGKIFRVKYSSQPFALIFKTAERSPRQPGIGRFSKFPCARIIERCLLVEERVFSTAVANWSNCCWRGQSHSALSVFMPSRFAAPSNPANTDHEKFHSDYRPEIERKRSLSNKGCSGFPASSRNPGCKAEAMDNSRFMKRAGSFISLEVKFQRCASDSRVQWLRFCRLDGPPVASTSQTFFFHQAFTQSLLRLIVPNPVY